MASKVTHTNQWAMDQTLSRNLSKTITALIKDVAIVCFQIIQYCIRNLHASNCLGLSGIKNYFIFGS